jgi:hypothetical protein
MTKYRYEHIFVQHPAGASRADSLAMDVASSLNAWGADGWEIAHMEGVWDWVKDQTGPCSPDTLRGYYVTFKRAVDPTSYPSIAVAEAEAPLPLEFSC